MREIKFRDYDHENKEMRYFDLDHYDREVHDSFGNIMQYTGLKDKNGQEVYEGDLVEVDGIVGTVVYEGDFTGFFSVFSDSNEIVSAKLNHPRIKVIGNIYENSNLVK